MSPFAAEHVAGDEKTSNHQHEIPEWTQEDDADIDVSPILENQRLRFRAASIAGWQRHHARLRRLPSSQPHSDMSQDANEIRATLRGRGLGEWSKRFGDAAPHSESGPGRFMVEAAEGFEHSASAAAPAFANGGGAGSAIYDVGKGVHAAAAVTGATASSDDDSSDDDSSDDDEEKKTLETPPPSQTLPPPPQPPSIESSKDQLTITTTKPILNLPPPKAQLPSPSSYSPPDSPTTSSSMFGTDYEDAKSTSSYESQKLPHSIIVPGATITKPSGPRLSLTPALSTSFDTITSGAEENSNSLMFPSTTPRAVSTAPTTMMTSTSTVDTRVVRPSKPTSDSSTVDLSSGRSPSSGGLPPSGQGALIFMGILLGGIAIFAMGYCFWRRRREQRNLADSNGGANTAKSLPSPPPLERAEHIMTRVSGRIALLYDRIRGSNGWKNITEPNGSTFTEKRNSGAGEAEAPKPEPIIVQTTLTQGSLHATVMGGTALPVEAWPMGGASAQGASPTETSTTGATAGGISPVGAAAAAFRPQATSPFEDPSDAPAKPPVRSLSQGRALVGSGYGPRPSVSSVAPQLKLIMPSTTTTLAARRISDMSSLSSGFGDGDIIVPYQQQQQQRRRQQQQQQQQQTPSNVLDRLPQGRPYSTTTTATASTSSSGSSGRRDTVYTEASEDLPPRFRTVSSWVRQQTGRVKRERQREEDAANESGTAPPVPPIPPEQDFGLMMPDGQVPRPVEDTDLATGGGDWAAETKDLISGVFGGLEVNDGLAERKQFYGREY